jgi:DNA-binding GntR family transcriptional regulator
VTLSRLERLLDYQAAAVKAKDIDEFYALDVRFHAALFDGLAMRRVAEVVDASRVTALPRASFGMPGRVPPAQPFGPCGGRNPFRQLL